MSGRLVIVAIAAIIGGVLIGMVASPDSGTGQAPAPAAPANGNVLPDNVLIGHIVPLSGDAALLGLDSRAGLDIGVADYNRYLESLGADWRIEVIHEDSQSNPPLALEKLTALKARGVDIVIGPYTSSNVRALVGYAESNNMVMISPSSTAPQLAIPGDAVFRLIPDDEQQALALARLMADSGIQTAAIIHRGDAWGDGLYRATLEAFEATGGVTGEPIRYNPEVSDFAVSVSLLADNVGGHVDEHRAASIGVLAIGFAETLEVLQDASQHDALGGVSWFCTDGFSTNGIIFDDSTALEFAKATDMRCTQTAVPKNPIRDGLETRLAGVLGHTPNTYAYSAYDSLWVAANAVLETGDTDAQTIKDVLIDVAARHNGALGNTKLNPAGDLDASTYAIWSIDGDAWVTDSVYIGARDTIISAQ